MSGEYEVPAGFFAILVGMAIFALALGRAFQLNDDAMLCADMCEPTGVKQFTGKTQNADNARTLTPMSCICKERP